MTRAAWRRFVVALGVALLLGGAAPRRVLAAGPAQQHFASPEEAAKALVEAVRSGDQTALLSVLGPDATRIVSSGDPTADAATGQKFVASYDAANTIVKDGDARAVLETGTDQWPLPIPIVKDDKGWRFDAAAGEQEILDRRIGRNELAVIQTCLAYVDAQREYYTRNPDGSPLLRYAQKIMSTKGKRDGLYWETKPDEPPSPLGSLVAGARSEGYRVTTGQNPYHGYYFRILKAQGKNAKGGAYDYVAHGQMIGGFAMVAYPATWGSSGVMTFVVNHDGVVFQKDLGPDTGRIATAMTKFDPDDSWTRVSDEDEATVATSTP